MSVMPTDSPPRRRGLIEALAAGTAVFVSLASLYIAWRQGKLMERQLAASVWPSLEYTTFNRDDEGKSIITMGLHNGGIGPARIRSFEVAYDGKTVRNTLELLAACCSAGAPREALVTEPIVGRLVPASQDVTFLTLANTPNVAALWKQLNSARVHVEGRACYCSALDECWSLELTMHAEPSPVASCAPAMRRPQFHE